MIPCCCDQIPSTSSLPCSELCKVTNLLAEIHFCVEKILPTKESASSGEDSALSSNSVEDGASNHHTKPAKVQVHLVVMIMMRMVTTTLSSPGWPDYDNGDDGDDGDNDTYRVGGVEDWGLQQVLWDHHLVGGGNICHLSRFVPFLFLSNTTNIP